MVCQIMMFNCTSIHQKKASWWIVCENFLQKFQFLILTMGEIYWILNWFWTSPKQCQHKKQSTDENGKWNSFVFVVRWCLMDIPTYLCKSTFFPLLQTLLFEIVPLRVTVYIIEEWTSSWLQRSISQMLILTSLLWVSVSGMGQADMRLLGLLFHQITALI